MKSTILLLAVLSLLFSVQLAVAEDSPRNGQLKDNGGLYKAWDDHSKKWVTPDVFWELYASRRGGLTWGKTSKYPAYEQVKEHDTIIIETGRGPCLMEFFHSRWRRANDVRRWDESFNDYGGCPHAFD